MVVNHRWLTLSALAISIAMCAQEPPQTPPGQPPRSDVESSSNDTKIDTSAPSNDAREHPDSDVSDVTEFHAFNPHKAMKDIEVGDYYYKRDNFKAAADRYQEALLFKPNDADATLRLARAQEKLKMFEDARDNYAAFLKQRSDGKDAEEARKALQRMPNPEAPASSQQ